MDCFYDLKKNTDNIRKHGVSLSLVEDFEWETAYILEDIDHTYVEWRHQAIGFVGNRLYVCVFCMPDVQTIMVISLRKANRREVRRYVENV